MIFVTVGTHEQQFDRLVKFVDELKKKRCYKGRCYNSDWVFGLYTYVLQVAEVVFLYRNVRVS